MRGGRLMVMVDPWSEALAAVPSPTGMPPTDTSVRPEETVRRLGHRLRPDEVIGDLTGAWRVRASDDDRVQAVNYVAWFNIRDGINHTIRPPADLTQITVAVAGLHCQGAGRDDRFHAVADQQRRPAGPVPLDSWDARPGEDPGRFQTGGRPAGHRRARARRAEVRIHRAAGSAHRDKSGRTNFPAYISRDGRAGQYGRGRGFRHPGRPLLGARSRTFSVSRPRPRSPTTAPSSPI